MNPAKDLKAGKEMLNDLMTKYGFEYRDVDSGESSGGLYASGCFERGDRRVMFSVRWSLGLVYYKIGDMTFKHEDYMRAAGISNQYPGFSKSISVAFEHLFSDLKANLLFLEGTDEEVKEKVGQAKKTKKMGFAALSG